MALPKPILAIYLPTLSSMVAIDVTSPRIIFETN